MWIVTECDDYGRPIKNLIIIREATDAKDARQQAANALGKPGIVNTGWYDAEPISHIEIEDMKFKLQSELEFFNRIV